MIQSMRVIWNERVGSLESEFSMRVGEEEEDVENVAMVDKIEVTVHVTIKFPSKFGLAQMT